MQRRAGLAVIQAAVITPAAPPPRPPLIQLEVDADATVIPHVQHGLIDQFQQPVLGGRLDAARDPATQPQRPFPSANINRMPISLIASVNRAISARSSGASGSRRQPHPRQSHPGQLLQHQRICSTAAAALP